MKARINLRCPACGWNTSRAPRADGDYGQCRECVYEVRPQRRREPRPPKTPKPAAPSKFDAWYAQKYGTGHTWPELVAAELERREREKPTAKETAL